MVSEPAVFGIAWDRLQEAKIEVRSNGTDIKQKYSELRRALIEEGVVESNWRGVAPTITTSRAEHHGPLGETQNLWKILCLDLHRATKLGSDVREVAWFLYEHDKDGDGIGRVDVYFAVVGGEIVDEHFAIFSSLPSWPSRTLIDTGVWKDLKPKDPDEVRAAWRIGWIRACYRKFYETTDTGRACGLAPGNSRFDAMYYWLDIKPPKDVPPSELSRQLDDLNKRLRSLRRFVTIVAVVGAAMVVAAWFSR